MPFVLGAASEMLVPSIGKQSTSVDSLIVPRDDQNDWYGFGSKSAVPVAEYYFAPSGQRTVVLDLFQGRYRRYPGLYYH